MSTSDRKTAVRRASTLPFRLHASVTCPPPAALAASMAWELGDLDAEGVERAYDALLVATPIIIHLINRIRFRRVDWAAMEFLLKAQKRMRRRKILGQLILLLLRCLLVFLVGILLARFLGSPDPSR